MIQSTPALVARVLSFDEYELEMGVIGAIESRESNNN